MESILTGSQQLHNEVVGLLFANALKPFELELATPRLLADVNLAVGKVMEGKFFYQNDGEKIYYSRLEFTEDPHALADGRPFVMIGTPEPKGIKELRLEFTVIPNP